MGPPKYSAVRRRSEQRDHYRLFRRGLKRQRTRRLAAVTESVRARERPFRRRPVQRQPAASISRAARGGVRKTGRGYRYRCERALEAPQPNRRRSDAR